MFNEYQKSGVRVSPKLLMAHHANNYHFNERAICNELKPMRSRGLLASVQLCGETLTLFGLYNL